MIRRRIDFVINDDKFRDAAGNIFQKIGSQYHEMAESRIDANSMSPSIQKSIQKKVDAIQRIKREYEKFGIKVNSDIDTWQQLREEKLRNGFTSSKKQPIIQVL